MVAIAMNYYYVFTARALESNLSIIKIILYLNYTVFIVIFSVVIFFSLPSQAITWKKTAHNFVSDTEIISRNSDGRKGLHVIYYDYFPWRGSYLHTDHTDCFLQKTAGKKSTSMLKCTEHLWLLVPVKTAVEWLSRQRHQGYFSLTVRQFGIYDVHAHITTDQLSGFYRSDAGSIQAGAVTGISKRHVLNLRKYFVRNKEKNTVTGIVVTPDHPFYAVNKHAFIPVKKISEDDMLITKEGYHAQLICHGKLKSNCGVPWHMEKITWAYNLEILRKHRYFAGSNGLLVHNICELEKQLYKHLPALVTFKGDSRWKHAYLKLETEWDMWRVKNLPEVKKHMSSPAGLGLDTLLRTSMTTKKELKPEDLDKLLKCDDFTAGAEYQQMAAKLTHDFGTEISLEDVLDDAEHIVSISTEKKHTLLISSDNIRMITDKSGDTGEAGFVISDQVDGKIVESAFDTWWIYNHTEDYQKKIQSIVQLDK